MGLSGAAIGTYRPQYRPLSVIRYPDANPLSTRYTLFITLRTRQYLNPGVPHQAIAESCTLIWEFLAGIAADQPAQN
jgi:hypothetical protein